MLKTQIGKIQEYKAAEEGEGKDKGGQTTA